MLITSVIRSLGEEITTKQIDILSLEWYETTKRIQRVRTDLGEELALRFMGTSMRLQEGDVLYEDADKLIVVNIKPCQSICMHPATALDMATLCFELGNKHLPVFLQDGWVCMPYEDAIYRWLLKTSYQPELRMECLWNQANPDMGLYYRQRNYSKKDLTIKLGE